MAHLTPEQLAATPLRNSRGFVLVETWRFGAHILASLSMTMVFSIYWRSRLASAAPLWIVWTAWRAQWEYAHAVRAVLLILRLSTLVLSVMAETPERPAPARRAD
jgi:MFS-type transporter involved in bile tolerance (Atg22 family)